MDLSLILSGCCPSGTCEVKKNARVMRGFLTDHAGNRRLQPPLLFGSAPFQVLSIAKSCVLWVLEIYLNRKMAILRNLCFFQMIACVSQNRLRKNPPAFMTMILLKKEILHQSIWQISQYLQFMGFVYLNWCSKFHHEYHDAKKTTNCEKKIVSPISSCGHLFVRNPQQVQRDESSSF